MKILLDMNLSVGWRDYLHTEGFDVLHWREVGNIRAPDSEIMIWARDQGRVVITHDLDFGNILAATGADAPSVIQLRAQNITTAHLGPTVVAVLKKFKTELDTGALISVDENASRTRLLSIRRT